VNRPAFPARSRRKRGDDTAEALHMAVYRGPFIAVDRSTGAGANENTFLGVERAVSRVVQWGLNQIVKDNVREIVAESGDGT
jgi:hypothetical protein